MIPLGHYTRGKGKPCPNSKKLYPRIQLTGIYHYQHSPKNLWCTTHDIDKGPSIKDARKFLPLPPFLLFALRMCPNFQTPVPPEVRNFS